MNAKQVLTGSILMLVFIWLLAGLGAAPAQGRGAPAMPQAQYPATTELISVAWDGSASDHGAGVPSTSADGRFVAFSSDSTNIVSDDTNNVEDVFVRDRQAGQTVRISMGIGGAQANGPSRSPTISADGRYVAYFSSATNLVPIDSNGKIDVFLADRDADANGIFDEPGHVNTILISVASDGEQGNDHSAYSIPYVSSDGRFVTF